jgi:hypothetical protein
MTIRPPAFVAMSLLTLAACGGDTKPAADAAAKPAEVAAPATITITTKDFAYEMPDTIVGGLVSLKLVNHGTTLHHVQFLKITDGKTYADLEAGFKTMKPGSPPPPFIHQVAGPNTPVPGGESQLTTRLEPGTYAVVCFVDTPDKVPHIMKGMMHPLTVTAPTGAAAPAPTADVTVTLTDYAFDVKPELAAGKHMIKLVNAAKQPHEMLIVQLDSGKTAEDLGEWAKTYKGPPPARPLGGISGMEADGEAYFPVDLAPGNYVLLCFLPDAKDGKQHLEHGMIRPITVK